MASHVPHGFPNHRPFTRLFILHTVYANINNIKAQRYWSFGGRIHSWPVNSPPKGLVMLSHEIIGPIDYSLCIKRWYPVLPYLLRQWNLKPNVAIILLTSEKINCAWNEMHAWSYYCCFVWISARDMVIVEICTHTRSCTTVRKFTVLKHQPYIIHTTNIYHCIYWDIDGIKLHDLDPLCLWNVHQFIFSWQRTCFCNR